MLYHKLADLGPALLCCSGILPAIRMLLDLRTDPPSPCLLTLPLPPPALASKLEKEVLLASMFFFLSYSCVYVCVWGSICFVLQLIKQKPQPR